MSNKWTDILINSENMINNYTFKFVNFHLIKVLLKENTVETLIGISHCWVATQGMTLKSIFTTFFSIIMASSMVLFLFGVLKRLVGNIVEMITVRWIMKLQRGKGCLTHRQKHAQTWIFIQLKSPFPPQRSPEGQWVSVSLCGAQFH